MCALVGKWEGRFGVWGVGKAISNGGCLLATIMPNNLRAWGLMSLYFTIKTKPGSFKDTCNGIPKNVLVTWGMWPTEWTSILKPWDTVLSHQISWWWYGGWWDHSLFEDDPLARVTFDVSVTEAIATFERAWPQDHHNMRWHHTSLASRHGWAKSSEVSRNQSVDLCMHRGSKDEAITVVFEIRSWIIVYWLGSFVKILLVRIVESTS